MNAPIAAVSNNFARTAVKRIGNSSKNIVNDSVAFYPSTQRNNVAQTIKGDAFAFYPSNGATRIQNKSRSVITSNAQESTNYTSKFSRAELDAIFAKSRAEAAPATNTVRLSTKDSMAFHAGRQNGMTVNTTTNAKDASFGFYSLNSKVTQKVVPSVKPQQANASATKPESSEKMSLLAAGSVAMGLMMQAGRSLARA